jgi:peptidoglycan hydrolase CwlO-like protein
VQIHIHHHHHDLSEIERSLGQVLSKLELLMAKIDTFITETKAQLAAIDTNVTGIQADIVQLNAKITALEAGLDLTPEQEAAFAEIKSGIDSIATRTKAIDDQTTPPPTP